MILREFINHRHECPLCDFPLTTTFHSKKWQNMKYIDDRMVVMFRMDGLKKKQKDYKVSYCFGLEDNSWYVDFYTKDEELIGLETQDHLRVRFKELNKNLKGYRFYKYCSRCGCYMYSSNFFELDFKKALISDLHIVDEHFGMAVEVENGFKIYKLINNPKKNQSIIMCSKNASDVWARADCNLSDQDMVQVPLIKFSSREEVIDRLKKLLVFS